MTKEEAIDILEKHKKNMPNGSPIKYALEEAIKYLGGSKE